MRKICVVVFSLTRSVSAAAPQASRAQNMCRRSFPFNLGMIAPGNHTDFDSLRAAPPARYRFMVRGWIDALPPALVRGVAKPGGARQMHIFHKRVPRIRTANTESEFLLALCCREFVLPPPQCAHWGTPLTSAGGEGGCAASPPCGFSSCTPCREYPACRSSSADSASRCRRRWWWCR